MFAKKEEILATFSLMIFPKGSSEGNHLVYLRLFWNMGQGMVLCHLHGIKEGGAQPPQACTTMKKAGRGLGGEGMQLWC